jgi:hypothetical protein
MLTWVGNTRDLWTPNSEILVTNLYFFGVLSDYFIPSILLKLVACIFKLMFTYVSIFPQYYKQLYATCHINEKTTP